MIAPLLFSALWKHSLGPLDAKPLDAASLMRCHIELLVRGLAPTSPRAADPKGRREPGIASGRKGRGPLADRDSHLRGTDS